jgi:hypothetical protein
MTQGRHETIYNCRPVNFDDRKFWASEGAYQHDPPAGLELGTTAMRSSTAAAPPRRKQYGCEHDHRLREACPFHDLRAEGCFQPEYGQSGPLGGTIPPEKMAARPSGNAMRHHAGEKAGGASMRGVGGSLMPCDTDPAKGRGPLGRLSGPWSTTAAGGPMDRGLFSTFQHQPDTAGSSPRGLNLSGGPRAGSGAPFHAGDRSVGVIGEHPTYWSNPYGRGPQGSAPSRLRAGVAPDVHRFPHLADPYGNPRDLNLSPQEDGKARRDRAAARSLSRGLRAPVDSRKHHMNTFGRYPEFLPDPVPSTMRREHKPALFTYQAHIKRTPPIMVPWTRGPQTADMRPIAAALQSVTLPATLESHVSVRSLPAVIV